MNRNCLAGWVVVLVLTAGLMHPTEAADGHPTSESYDVVVYGGTSAGVIAAVQAKRMGKTAVIVGPDRHLGGLTSGGLGWTDSGNKNVVGGLSRDFYHRIWQKYQQADRWRQGSPEDVARSVDNEGQTMWVFEPHVAEEVYEDYVRELAIPVHRDEWLDRESGVEKNGARITAIRMLSGKRFVGRVFIDATYEGDLMATAGVDYHVGREGRDVYGEQLAGIQTGVLHHHHHFGDLPPISPYVVPGDPSSGVLPRISPEPPGEKFSGDERVQAYCFRMCLTDAPENRIAFSKPDGYDPAQYELLARVYEAGFDRTFVKFDPMPNRKTDTNNHGPFSTDNIGFNYDYPDASYERRREIVAEHETYQKGWLYFIANDPRIPAATQKEMRRWGLPKDEFVDNGHWSHQLYIREARRMVGVHVMTEHELLKQRPTPQSIGMGSYSIDSHNVQRYITPEGTVQNEGDLGVSTGGPYEISLGSILPKPSQCDNLLVPVCVSSSHIAFGSIRMEPVFMVLGQSAATVATMAIDDQTAVQAVPYERIKPRLLDDGQVLTYQGRAAAAVERVDPSQLEGIVVDDEQIDAEGWAGSAMRKYVGHGYRHDGNANKGRRTAVFRAESLSPGRYEVRLAYPVNANRATNVPVTISHAGGNDTVVVNQREKPPIEGLFLSLGEFEFNADSPASVTISNADTDGYVVIDAVQWRSVTSSR